MKKKKSNQRKLSISTSSTVKTVTFTSQMRDLYVEIKKKQEKKGDERLQVYESPTSTKKFLSPRDHFSTKESLRRKSLGSNFTQNQRCIYCKQELKYNPSERNSTLLSRTLPITSKITMKKSFSGTSFFSKIFSCFGTPMTYEEHLMTKSRERFNNLKKKSFQLKLKESF